MVSPTDHPAAAAAREAFDSAVDNLVMKGLTQALDLKALTQVSFTSEGATNTLPMQQNTGITHGV